MLKRFTSVLKKAKAAAMPTNQRRVASDYSRNKPLPNPVLTASSETHVSVPAAESEANVFDDDEGEASGLAEEEEVQGEASGADLGETHDEETGNPEEQEGQEEETREKNDGALDLEKLMGYHRAIVKGKELLLHQLAELILLAKYDLPLPTTTSTTTIIRPPTATLEQAVCELRDCDTDLPFVCLMHATAQGMILAGEASKLVVISHDILQSIWKTCKGLQREMLRLVVESGGTAGNADVKKIREVRVDEAGLCLEVKQTRIKLREAGRVFTDGMAALRIFQLVVLGIPALGYLRTWCREEVAENPELLWCLQELQDVPDSISNHDFNLALRGYDAACVALRAFMKDVQLPGEEGEEEEEEEEEERGRDQGDGMGC